MKFYRATVRYDEIYYDQRKTIGKICLDLNSKYWDTDGHIHVIVSQVTNSYMEIICAVNNPCTKESIVTEKITAFISEVRYELKYRIIDGYTLERIKEITLNTFVEVFNEYSSITLIEDKELIRNDLGINEGSFLYNEILFDVDELSKQDKHGYFFDKIEKRRIKTGRKINRPMVSPIHYVIYEDDSQIRDSICNELIGCLWKQGRVNNRRIVKISDEDAISNIFRKKVYNLNTLDGGVVVIDLKSDASKTKSLLNLVSEDNNYSYSDKYTIIIMANTQDMDGYNNSIRECFSSMAFYKIVNQRINRKNAKSYFEELINNDELELENDSWKELFNKNNYTYYEISQMYKKWRRNNYYIEKYFTQYKEFVTEYFDKKEGNTSISGREQLEELIGLESVKRLITEIIDYNKISRVREETNPAIKRVSLHMDFLGNPGTAKTTVARIVGRILKEEGILEKGELIEVGRGDLVGKYVGWTAKNIQEIFQKAKGSVLFIDEAYSLLDGQDSFGDEAINTIVQEMENLRDEVVVIMAGYKDEMYSFINKNSGMRSRIQFYIDFPDYSKDEMYMILELLAQNEGMILDEGVKEMFEEVICKEQYLRGNGRSVRNIFEMAKLKQASRLMLLSESEMKNEINILKKEDLFL